MVKVDYNNIQTRPGNYRHLFFQVGILEIFTYKLNSYMVKIDYNNIQTPPGKRNLEDCRLQG